MYGVQSQHIRKNGLFSISLVSRFPKSYIFVDFHKYLAIAQRDASTIQKGYSITCPGYVGYPF
jgi:hypothetical protein